MPLTRITVTIPGDLVRAADEQARALDRSRSWVIADALKRQVAPDGAGTGAAATTGGPATPATDTRGLGRFRHAQLQADLRLSPEQRVREAERTARVSELRGRRPSSNRVLTFDRYEDYLDWQRREELTP
jgi:hypothetical protein